MTEERFYQYDARLAQTAKTMIPALVLINSAPFLVLLSSLESALALKAGKVVSETIMLWGLGSAFGVSLWFFAYLNALFTTLSIARKPSFCIKAGVFVPIVLGIFFGIASLAFFIMGVLEISYSLNKFTNSQ